MEWVILLVVEAGIVGLRVRVITAARFARVLTTSSERVIDVCSAGDLRVHIDLPPPSFFILLLCTQFPFPLLSFSISSFLRLPIVSNKRMRRANSKRNAVSRLQIFFSYVRSSMGNLSFSNTARRGWITIDNQWIITFSFSYSFASFLSLHLSPALFSYPISFLWITDRHLSKKEILINRIAIPSEYKFIKFISNEPRIHLEICIGLLLRTLDNKFLIFFSFPSVWSWFVIPIRLSCHRYWTPECSRSRVAWQ